MPWSQPQLDYADRVCVTCGEFYRVLLASRRTVCEACWFRLPGNAWLRHGVATRAVERAAEVEHFMGREDTWR